MISHLEASRGGQRSSLKVTSKTQVVTTKQAKRQVQEVVDGDYKFNSRILTLWKR